MDVGMVAAHNGVVPGGTGAGIVGAIEGGGVQSIHGGTLIIAIIAGGIAAMTIGAITSAGELTGGETTRVGGIEPEIIVGAVNELRRGSWPLDGVSRPGQLPANENHAAIFFTSSTNARAT